MWIWLMVDVALRSAYCTRFMQVFLELISNRPWLLGSSSSSFSDCLEEIFLCVVGRRLRWCLYDPLVLPETLKELKNPLVRLLWCSINVSPRSWESSSPLAIVTCLLRDSLVTNHLFPCIQKQVKPFSETRSTNLPTYSYPADSN